MNAWWIVPSCQKRTFRIATQLVVQLICLVFACATSLFGQSLVANEYLDVSVGSNGTIYATGITDAGNMSIHSADVTTTITSPNWRRALAYNSVSSGGYARADTSLPFDQSDIGDFFANAAGSAYCPVVNRHAYPSASSTITIGYSDNWYKYSYKNTLFDPPFCIYTLNPGCTATCQATEEGTFPPCWSEPGTGHKQYIEAWYYWWRLRGSTTRHCIISVQKREADSPGQCSDTP